MKNILILGASRCGKSTLSSLLLSKYPYQVIHIDQIRNTFTTVFPHLNINSKTARNNREFQDFIFEYFKKCIKHRNSYILEGCDISVENSLRYISDNTLLLFLGSTNISIESFEKNIRLYDRTKDWTNNLTDEELIECSKNIISQSKEIKEKCDLYHLTYVETSHQRDIVLAQIIKNLKHQI